MERVLPEWSSPLEAFRQMRCGKRMRTLNRARSLHRAFHEATKNFALLRIFGDVVDTVHAIITVQCTIVVVVVNVVVRK